jgi:sugar lactone lactonase YvrE
VYAWDVLSPDGSDGERIIIGKRAIFQSLEGVPDGIKVAANGYLLVATRLSTWVDVLTARGRPIARIQTSHPVQNIVFAGEGFKTLYLVGIGGITKVQWNLEGPNPKAYY